MTTGVGGSSAKHQRSPSHVGEQRQHRPGFTAVDGAETTAITAAKRYHVSRDDKHDASAQTAALKEHRQQSEMQVLQHTRLLTQLQTLPSVFSAATELTRNAHPATADRQREPDCLQHDRI